jgi:cytochrome P450
VKADTDVPTLDLSRMAALRLLRRDPIALLERAATLGDVVQMPLPRVRAYLVNDPELVWDVLSIGNKDFVKSPAARNLRWVLGDGLLTSEGERHRRQRLLIQPTFHRDRVARYSAAMIDEAERFSDQLRPGAIDVHAAMSRLTLAIVGRAIFSSEVGSADSAQIAAALNEVLSQFGRQFSPWLPITRRLPIPSTRRFDRAVRTFDRLITEMIEERRRADRHDDDLLSHLLDVRDDGEAMSDMQVRDEALTLLLAGHETTSNALTWTWWLLSQHPGAEQRLHAELDDVLGAGAPEVEDLARLPYTDAVIAESLRIRPPAWAIGRQAVTEHRLGNIMLAPQDIVVVSPWLLHQDERWWTDAGRFRPERWVDGDPGRPRHAYLPFGGGPRMCIGEGFASMETRLLLATIARRWRFDLDPSAAVELQPVITLRPRHGMPMVAHARPPGHEDRPG